MPRLDPVSRADNTDPLVESMYGLLFGDRDPAVEPGTATGTPGDWWTVFANDTKVFEHAIQGFGVYRSVSIDPILREWAQARAGYATQSQFVFSQHCKALRGLGATEEQIAAIPHWSAADCFGEVDRLVLAYTDCLVYDLGRVPDALFDRLRGHFSDRELLELTYVASLYMMHGVMSRALRTEWDDVDERVTEVFVDDADDDLLRISADDVESSDGEAE